MQTWLSWTVSGLLVLVALSGCAGKKGSDGDADSEPDPATFGTTLYDRAIGNDGFRVTGSVTGTAAALGDGSAVQLDVVDVVASDADGARDKATLILDAKETGLNVVATLKEMVRARDAGVTADFLGGVGQNVKIHGTTGRGGGDLAESNAVLFAIGRAQVRVNDQPLATNQLAFVMVQEGVRDDAQASLTAADTHDLEVHVLFPGPLVAGNPAVPGIPDGFLYYYFEAVAVSQLTETEKADVGKTLKEPDKVNLPPRPAGQVLVGGQPTLTATKEGDANLTVTFDGSGSTDPDGTVSAWVWKVFELNSTGAYQKPEDSPALVSGKTVEYQFTSPGVKVIELVVRDDGGAIANLTLTFYINSHRVFTGGNSTHSYTAGAFTQCFDTLNCFVHRVSIGRGIEGGKIKFVVKAGQAQNPNIDLYPPGVDPPAPPASTPAPAQHQAGAELTLDKAKVQSPGAYNVAVWWQAGGAMLNYTLDVTLTYAPALPADGAGGAGAGAAAPEDAGLLGSAYVSTNRT